MWIVYARASGEVAVGEISVAKITNGQRRANNGQAAALSHAYSCIGAIGIQRLQLQGTAVPVDYPEKAVYRKRYTAAGTWPVTHAGHRDAQSSTTDKNQSYHKS